MKQIALLLVAFVLMGMSHTIEFEATASPAVVAKNP